MAACRPTTPKQFIQPGEMENILVDYHVAMAMAQEVENRDYHQQYYMELVLRQHGVTRADFDSSMVYYYTRSDRFSKMYRHVAERLEEKALSLGATEGEIGRYAMLNATGDTANIWPDRREAFLRPAPPYNRLDFALEADSTYMRGDSFLFQLMADFVYQDGRKEAMLFMAVDHPDTTVFRVQRISVSGLSQLRIDTNDTLDVKRVRGFIYLQGANELTTTQRMLFISNIQLIRFHKKHEPKQDKAHSLPSDSIAGRTAIDSVGGGTKGGDSAKVLPADRRIAPNRVVERDGHLDTRR